MRTSTSTVMLLGAARKRERLGARAECGAQRLCLHREAAPGWRSGSQSLAAPPGPGGARRGVALLVSSRSTKNTCSLIRMIYNRNDNILVGRDHTFAARSRVVLVEMALWLLAAAGSATQQKTQKAKADGERVRP